MNKSYIANILTDNYKGMEARLAVNVYNDGFLLGYARTILIMWESDTYSQYFDVDSISDFQNKINAKIYDSHKFQKLRDGDVYLFYGGLVRGMQSCVASIDEIMGVK